MVIDEKLLRFGAHRRHGAQALIGKKRRRQGQQGGLDQSAAALTGDFRLPSARAAWKRVIEVREKQPTPSWQQEKNGVPDCPRKGPQQDLRGVRDEPTGDLKDKFKQATCRR
jgi:hypothetical protein